MLTYSELAKQNKMLTEENNRLKKEISELKAKFSVDTLPKKNTFQLQNTAVTMQSSTQEKIALFRSLFFGREDVFARRWYSNTTGKSGYQPVCTNEWVEGLCDKKKYKCSACPNRKLLPLGDRDIFAHLAGKDDYCRDVIGIYPMLPDETCRFLCIDFDEENFKDDVKAFLSVCEKNGIPAVTEISRSGNGAHIWIFFENATKARTARSLGTVLLTSTMELNSRLSFRSYDRMFPNQDTMPDGGFGNLVALPLQGKARKNGNSLFVDNDFLPFSDQWAYLSLVKRMSLEQTEDCIHKLCKNGELGSLVSDSEEKPWEPTKHIALSKSDFPDKLEITKANMLYIPTKGLSPVALNKIKRLAAFKNPDFYRAQAMRMPIYNKPRVICTADITEDYIGLPRGCEATLYELLKQANTNFSIYDKTNFGREIPVTFSGKLREEQNKAAEVMLQYDTGVLSATTAFGKTVVASYLIGQRKTNTLILVHTQSLMTQWKSSLEKFLNIDIEPLLTKRGSVRKNWSPIGILGAGKNTLHGNVDIAVMQSLVNDDEVKEYVRDYGMIIVDVCHHISAVNFEKILKFATAKSVYGLTATPTRQDGHHPIVFMQCGPIRYKVDAKAQAEKRSFEHYLIPRFTAFRSSAEKKNINELYSELSENENRNMLIINDVIESLEHNRCPIIMTERREHVELLSALLSKHCKNIITLFGASSQKIRKETMEQLLSIPQTEPLLIIATGKYVGEGFDYPRLDTLFLALPISWKGKVAQYAGRLHRNFEGKTDVRIYDYADIHVPTLEKMYQKRLKGYASIGYKTLSDAGLNLTPDLIYDGKSFYPVYCNDLLAASESVQIVSPFLRKSRIKQLINVFSKVVENGAAFTVVTRPAEDFKVQDRYAVKENTELLEKLGIKVIFKSRFHQKFTVIDSKIVWYGSVNFLSFGGLDESVMRFISSDVAGQLIDTVM